MRKILLFLVFAALVGGFIGYRMWNKPYENMQTATPAVTVEAAELFQAYSSDETAAAAKYGNDQTVAVRGVVKEVTKEDGGSVKILLDTGADFGVLAELDPLTKHPRTDFNAGETITVKGKCTGLNLDVQLARCVVVN